MSDSEEFSDYCSSGSEYTPENDPALNKVKKRLIFDVKEAENDVVKLDTKVILVGYDDTSGSSSENFHNIAKTMSYQKVPYTKVRQLRFEKTEPFTVFYKLDHDQTVFAQANVNPKCIANIRVSTSSTAIVIPNDKLLHIEFSYKWMPQLDKTCMIALLKEYKKNNFLDFHNIAKTMSYQKVPYTKVRQLRFEKTEPFTVFYKLDHDQTVFAQANVNPKCIANIRVSTSSTAIVIPNDKLLHIEFSYKWMPQLDKTCMIALLKEYKKNNSTV
ncbi:hypothetical protein FQA39_LY10091 [Lamprigera yunnana]|nr:hypothetical protein FQA39_LY10091 [Lamprigera yunnana]